MITAFEKPMTFLLIQVEGVLKNLSSGMQVRLAFSTAIQTDPEILLMDEVLWGIWSSSRSAFNYNNAPLQLETFIADRDLILRSDLFYSLSLQIISLVFLQLFLWEVIPSRITSPRS